MKYKRGDLVYSLEYGLILIRRSFFIGYIVQLDGSGCIVEIIRHDIEDNGVKIGEL